MNMWLAVLVIGIAAAAHQAWSANIFTTVSDMFPKRAVASVTGIGGMAGGLGGIALTALVQKRMFVHYESIGQLDKAYFIMFLICGGGLPAGLGADVYAGAAHGAHQARRRITWIGTSAERARMPRRSRYFLSAYET